MRITIAVVLLVLSFQDTIHSCCISPPPNNCVECRNGIWVTKPGVQCSGNSECSSGYCDTTRCLCSCPPGSCWTTASTDDRTVPCSPCNLGTGCIGTTYHYNSYLVWQDATGSGYCYRPTRHATIGWEQDCDENWNWHEIAECGISLGSCAGKCAACATAPSPVNCGSCLYCVLAHIFELPTGCSHEICDYVDKVDQCQGEGPKSDLDHLVADPANAGNVLPCAN